MRWRIADVVPIVRGARLRPILGLAPLQVLAQLRRQPLRPFVPLAHRFSTLPGAIHLDNRPALRS